MTGRDVGRRAVAEELDGELLVRCAEFRAVEAEMNHISDVLGSMLMAEREAHPLARREPELFERYRELRELIADIPAKTLQAIEAKARVVLSEFRGEDNSSDFPGQYDPRGALALSLARDLIGRSA